MISAGQNFPNQNSRVLSATRWLLANRATTPMSMRTAGPASERRWRGGGMYAGLAMHSLVGGRNIRIYRRGRRRSNVGQIRFRRCRTLNDLNHPNDQQNQRPGVVEVCPLRAQVIEQEQNPHCDHDRRTHDSLAAVAPAL